MPLDKSDFDAEYDKTEDAKKKVISDNFEVRLGHRRCKFDPTTILKEAPPSFIIKTLSVVLKGWMVNTNEQTTS